jgi:hypothetical protein
VVRRLDLVKRSKLRFIEGSVDGPSGRLCLTGLGTEKYAVMVGRISFVILCKMVLAEAMRIYDRIEWSVLVPKSLQLG